MDRENADTNVPPQITPSAHAAAADPSLSTPVAVLSQGQPRADTDLFKPGAGAESLTSVACDKIGQAAQSSSGNAILNTILSSTEARQNQADVAGLSPSAARTNGLSGLAAPEGGVEGARHTQENLGSSQLVVEQIEKSCRHTVQGTIDD